jgi:hypothetical protein
VPIAHRAGNVGGAVDVLRARIDQEQLARLERAVAFGRHPVMHDRRMLAGAGDRVEGNILERVLHALPDLGARRFQLLGNLDLGDRAGLGLSSQHRNSTIAAPSCRCAAAEPLISTLFFTARGSLAGSLPSTTIAARRADDVGKPIGGQVGIDQHPAAILDNGGKPCSSSADGASCVHICAR